MIVSVQSDATTTISGIFSSSIFHRRGTTLGIDHQLKEIQSLQILDLISSISFYSLMLKLWNCDLALKESREEEEAPISMLAIPKDAWRSMPMNALGCIHKLDKKVHYTREI